MLADIVYQLSLLPLCMTLDTIYEAQNNSRLFRRLETPALLLHETFIRQITFNEFEFHFYPIGV